MRLRKAGAGAEKDNAKLDWKGRTMKEPGAATRELYIITNLLSDHAIKKEIMPKNLRRDEEGWSVSDVKSGRVSTTCAKFSVNLDSAHVHVKGVSVAAGHSMIK